MTQRKAQIVLPNRTPAYVDETTGAAELRISPETWRRWVAEGILPPPAPGFPETAPRWRWEDVDRKMSGKAQAEPNGLGERTAKFFGAKAGRKRVCA